MLGTIWLEEIVGRGSCCKIVRSWTPIISAEDNKIPMHNIKAINLSRCGIDLITLHDDWLAVFGYSDHFMCINCISLVKCACILSHLFSVPAIPISDKIVQFPESRNCEIVRIKVIRVLTKTIACAIPVIVCKWYIQSAVWYTKEWTND